MSDYLWDKSGSDPEVERLETALAPLAYRGQLGKMPRLPRRRAPIGAFVAAGLAAAAILSLVIWPPWHRPAVAWTEGHAVIAGRWLESAAAPVRLDLGAMGGVELAPGTRARMLGEGRMELEAGTLTAQIAAAPRRFSIETRFARVIDLGCAFALSVDEHGGRLVVTAGAVALAKDGREVVVAAGQESSFGVEVQPAHQSARPEAPKTETPKTEAPKTETLPKTETPAKKLIVKQPHVAPHIAAPQHNLPPPPQKTTPPAKKSDPGLRLQHDSLKDLDRNL